MAAGGKGHEANGDRPKPSLILAAGPRAVEAALLARIQRDLDVVLEAPEILSQPLRIVVPSRSAQEHVSAAVVRGFGRPIAGLQVQTLQGLALEVLDRAGIAPSQGDVFVAEVVRSLARREASLAKGLDDLDDAYGVVEASVRDLLDAGFAPALEDAALERLAEAGVGDAGTAIGRAVVRVASRTAESLEALGLGTRSRPLVDAREALEASVVELPSRGLVVHGFAEATGVASDFIEALVRHCDADVLLDLPELPAGVTASSISPGLFSRKLFDRVAGILPIEIWDATPELARRVSPVEVFKAPGAEAEVRGTAERIRGLLASGTRPEAIGVVARDASQYRIELRTHFHRLAIPYSALSLTCVGGGSARRLESLERLLREAGECTSETWLELVRWGAAGAKAEGESGAKSRAPTTRAGWADLRLGVHALGAGRLRDLAQLSVPAHDLKLPARHGVPAAAAAGEEDHSDAAEALDDADPGDESAFRTDRRVLDREIIAWAIGAAKRLTGGLARWPKTASFSAHHSALRDLLHEFAGLAAAPELVELLAEFESFDALLPNAFELSREGFTRLCARRLRGLRDEPLGGTGGGVQVLGVMEARARTFEHLFVLGMNRDVFPRVAREDPLLPDDLRRPLRDVLPDLPVKSAAVDEERYLFAQLLRAADHLTLSWQIATEDGSPKAPSSLIESLRQLVERDGGRFEPSVAPGIHAPLASALDDALRPAHESLLRAGLASRKTAAPLWGPALEDAQIADTRVEVSALARARLAVLDEIDPPTSRAPTLGPYFGFVGELLPVGDPRDRDIYVTQLEALGRCPWQYFVEKLLRIEATPDPLESLPEVDALALGSAVHAVLERIDEDRLEGVAPSGLAEVLERDGVVLAWPDREGLDEIIRRVAARQLAESGRFWPGLEVVLRERMAPLVDRAHVLAWATPDAEHTRVLGVELEGCVEGSDGAGQPRPISFRADRVERVGSAIVLTDYKTGKPFSTGKTLATRQKHLVERIRAGTHLQAAAYALSLGTSEGCGRYLYFKDGCEPEQADVRAESQEVAVADAFHAGVADLFEARDRGSFVPRLFTGKDDKEPLECKRCVVAEACIRGDSGARARLGAWLGVAADEESRTPAELAAERASTMPQAGRVAADAFAVAAKAAAKEGGS